MLFSEKRVPAILIAVFVGLSAGAAFGQKKDSPIRGFLIVEPFETRVEFLLEAAAVVDALELPKGENLDAGVVRELLQKKVKQWSGTKFSATTDAGPLAHELTRVDFVKPDPVLGIAVDDREQIPLAEAKIGLVFAAKIPAPPGTVELKWDFFTDEIQEATVEFGSPGRWSARIVTPSKNTVMWQNSDNELVTPTLENVPAPNSRKPLNLPWSLIISVIGFGFVIAIALAKKVAPAWAGIGLIVCIAATVVLRKAPRIPLPNPFSKPELVSADAAESVTYALLRNVYKAFEYRSESHVYDALDKSVAGNLLEKIYLEIQASLQLENQGGARVRVYNVDLRKCDPTEQTATAGFIADCNWITAGTVTHWGHTHERTNRYDAVLTVDPVGNAWKLSGLKLVNEERIDQQSKKNSE